MTPSDGNTVQVRVPTDSETIDAWLGRLEHRAAHPDLVRRVFSAQADAQADESIVRLRDLDPLRERPRMDEDPDGAVVVDVRIVALGDPPDAYVSAIHWGSGLSNSDAREIVRRLLDRGDLFATPECRARLEGRARYNLAFDAARLSQEALP